MIYFASDFHLGLPNNRDSLKRQKLIIDWLDSISHDATDIFLVGDVFEFWYEWKYAVPKYFTRFFGKLAELSDKGINLHFFAGNHDMWAYGYFEEELGMKIYDKPTVFTFNGKKFFIAHGDGLGPGDKTYKFLKKIFTNKFLRWLTTNFIHPDWLSKLAMKVSKRRYENYYMPKFKGKDEWLVKYAIHKQQSEKCDYYIFGHRHLAVDCQLPEMKVVILGDWIDLFTYAIFDGNNLKMRQFANNLINPSSKGVINIECDDKVYTK